MSNTKMTSSLPEKEEIRKTNDKIACKKWNQKPHYIPLYSLCQQSCMPPGIFWSYYKRKTKSKF